MLLKTAFVGFIFILNLQMEMKKKMPKDLKQDYKFFCICHHTLHITSWCYPGLIVPLPIFKKWDCLRHLWGKNMQALT